MRAGWVGPSSVSLRVSVRDAPVSPLRREGSPVSRRTRLSLLPVALVVALFALVGCGGSDSSSSSSSSDAGTAEGIKAVTISGDVGKEPDVTWHSKMTATDVQNTTVTA